MKSGCLLLVALVCGCYGVQLPSYINKCNISSPELANCIVGQSPKVIASIINGDKSLKLQSLNPFRLKEIQIQATRSLSVKLYDVELHNLGSAVFTHMEVDMENKHSIIEIFFPNVLVKAKYDIKGQILIMPIVGNGNGEVNFINATFRFTLAWKIEKDKNGVGYGKLVDPKLSYKTEKMTYHLDNLFNGNKALGDQMNIFLNENWREFAKDIEPAVSAAISSVVVQILQSFGSSIPFEDMFIF